MIALKTNLRALGLLPVLLMVQFTGPVACAASNDVELCGGQGCAAKNPLIKRVNILQNGLRPRWSPDSELIVFDRSTDDQDQHYHVFLMTREGCVLRSLTENRPGIPQKNNGNAVFHPSGKFVAFISEEPQHFLTMVRGIGNPGYGLFSNLWATDTEGKRFWKLTSIPLKKGYFDKTAVYATVNPLFSPKGDQLLWTERYLSQPGRWGSWRLKVADFAIRDGVPSISNERVFFTPRKGNYVTAMGFLSDGQVIMAGNLDGQHDFGMDQYRYDPASGALKNLTNTPDRWEEDSSVTPDDHIIYMSNAASRYNFEFQNPRWEEQPMERDYYIMDRDGNNKQRLTYFNDPSAPEHLNARITTVASGMSPDGRFLAGSMGVDMRMGPRRDHSHHKVVLIEFSHPL